MKWIQNVWIVGLLGLAACSGNDLEKALLKDLPVVAHTVKVDGQDVLVNEFDLLEDTVDLPLSYWVEDLTVVKLDGRDEALVGMGPVYISDNYILIGRQQHIPFKLFRKDGSYVGNVGSVGQGPGEYTNVYDVQIDEKGERIYLLPWNARSILVYNLQGEYIKDIPLNRKYEKLIVPKGVFRVNAEENRIAVVLLPFNFLPVVAWVQDMEGNFIHEIKADYLKVKPNFSNEVISSNVSDELGIHLFTFFEVRKDTLYHLGWEDKKLQPQFTTNFNREKTPIHVYYEFPKQYVGMVSTPKEVAPGQYMGQENAFYFVDKESKKGAFFRIKNDYLDNELFQYLPLSIGSGFYTQNLDPAALMECLEKALKNPDLSENKRKDLEKLLASIDEDDNNYIFYGKLKTKASASSGDSNLLNDSKE